MLKPILLALSLTVVVTGCGKDGSPSGGAGGSSQQYTVNGIEASQAFAKFNYYQEGSCAQNNYRYNFASSFFVNYTRANGSKGTFGLKLFLSPDGRGRMIDDLSTDRPFDFKWHVDKTDLILEGVGSAQYGEYNGEPRLYITVNENFKGFKGLEEGDTLNDGSGRVGVFAASFDQKTFRPAKGNPRDAMAECLLQVNLHKELFSRLKDF